MEWHSYRVLPSGLFNTLDSGFCLEALQVSLPRFGKPIIFNIDQGSQFTNEVFLNLLRSGCIHISTDGQGRWCDNTMIERPWWSLKCECTLLLAFQDPHEAWERIRTWTLSDNGKRPHWVLRSLM